MRAIKVESVEIIKNPKTSTTTAKTTFSILVTPNLQNPRGAMHGGARALLIDMCTTMAVAPLSTEEFWHFGGLTRTLNLTCLKPVPGGEVVWVDCEVKGIGKRLGKTLSCTQICNTAMAVTHIFQLLFLASFETLRARFYLWVSMGKQQFRTGWL
jgi:hypothetical protein